MNKKFYMIVGISCALCLLYMCDCPEMPCDDPPCTDMTDSSDTSDIIVNCNPTVFDFSTIIPDIITDFPSIDQPGDNIATVEGIDLGRHLFYDKITSLNKGTSCASCHHPELAFTDNLVNSINEAGNPTPFSTISLINIAWKPRLFWDGRVTTVEAAVEDAIVAEHSIDWVQAINDLTADTMYVSKFQSAFCEKTIKKDHIIKALAQFLRTMISMNSKYDVDRINFTSSEDNGLLLFREEASLSLPGADCIHCHSEPTFLDFELNSLGRNNGLDSFPDPGHMAISNDPSDCGKFIAPTLRNIEFTAPYMHDGRFNTLEEVIDFYSDHVINVECTDELMVKDGKVGGVKLNPVEKADLIAFLKTLSDTTYLNEPRLQNPF